MNKNTTVAAIGSLAAFIALSAGVVTSRSVADINPAEIHRSLLASGSHAADAWHPAQPASGELAVEAYAAAPHGETALRAVPAAQRFLTVAVGRNADANLGATLPQAFAAQQVGVAADFVQATDREAIDQVMFARADAALVAGNLTERDRMAGLEATEVGLELFALVVPANSPVRSLTNQQVRSLLRGEAQYWSEFGFDLGPIRLIAPRDAGLRERAARALCRGDNLDTRGETTGDDEATRQRVRDGANAIGLVRLREGVADPALRCLQIDWAEPGVDTFVSGRYPYGSRLSLVTKGVPKAEAQQLCEFLRSEDGRELLGRNLLPR
ncbi:MAG: hypothetical protein RL398_863 [Planctomycetota bacterium]